MIRFHMLAVAGLVLALSGCASTGSRDQTRVCPADPNQVVNSQGCINATAAEGYEYAVLAALAYEPKPPPDFDIPEGFVVAESCAEPACDGTEGYQYRVFHRIRGEQIVEKVIAFRGTDGRDDWATNIFGNKDQNRAALATFLKVRGDGSIPVSVTGDSLGGALATQVSMCNAVHKRVAFNSSPRFYQSLCPGGRAVARPTDANRTLLLFSEYGEALGPTRWLGRNPDQWSTPVNCMSGASPVDQHDVRRLAACMIHLASEGRSEDARRYRDRNRLAFDKFLPNPAD
ncbi:hypothetical protein [Phenylobacterium sp.]|jgi:hypothetical protein|uniref:hypothetical protein n=1 Tax=Phenylobacterium sp. TaxID=1871053 RepID=UPI0037C7BD6C